MKIEAENAAYERAVQESTELLLKKHQSDIDERDARAEMWRTIVSVLHVLKRGLEKEFDEE